MENADKGLLAKVTSDQTGLESEIERLMGELDGLQITAREKDNQISTQEMAIEKLIKNVKQ